MSLDRNDLRHHAFVAVTARHLVAGLKNLALHRDEDFYHLHHAGRQFRRRAAVFSTLSRKRCFKALLSIRRTASAWPRFPPSVLSLGEANIHHCDRGCSSSTARVILVSLLETLGTGDALAVFFQQLREDGRRRYGRRNPPLFRRRGPWQDASISSRSESRQPARSSLSTPCRLNTRTSTMVPCTPGGTRSEVSRTSGKPFRRRLRARAFSSGVHRASRPSA